MKLLSKFLPFLLGMVVVGCSPEKKNEEEKTKFEKIEVLNGQSLTAKIGEPGFGFGHDHGQTPDWGALLGETTFKNDLSGYISQITFSFVQSSDKDSNQVDIIVEGKNNEKKTYNLSFKGKKLQDGNYLLHFDLNGKTVPQNQGELTIKLVNQLEFFSQTDYLYKPQENEIIAITQLKNIGATNYKTVDLKDSSAFESALSYSKNNSAYNIADDVGSIVIIYKK